MAKPEKHVFVCTHTRPSDDPKGCCTARGGQAVVDAFVGAFEARGLWGRFKLNTSSCFGTCGTVAPKARSSPSSIERARRWGGGVSRSGSASR